MRNRLSVAVASFSFLTATSPARAEKLEGVLWDVGPRVIVEGVEVVVSDQTRIERKGHPGITPRELRIGWEVEVQGRRDGDRLVAEKIKVETERHKKTDVEGYVESLVRIPSTSTAARSGTPGSIARSSVQGFSSTAKASSSTTAPSSSRSTKFVPASETGERSSSSRSPRPSSRG